MGNRGMTRLKPSTNLKGFTLIEIAIVIVIVSLVIAGIAGGKALVDQARLRSVISEMDEYNSAYNNFKDRYQAVPGDMNKAYDIWGAKCTAGAPADCNGNGNSIIEYANDATNEVTKAWKHLSLAGMLGKEMSFDPADGPGEVTIGKQIPFSKIGGAGYIFQGPIDSNTAMFGSTANGVMLAGGEGVGSNLNIGAMLPEDVFAIDQKIDDGSYNASGLAIGGTSGRIRAFDPSASTTDCVDVNTGAYSVTTTTSNCMLGVASDAQVGPMKYFGTVAATGIGNSSSSGGGGSAGDPFANGTAGLPSQDPGFISQLINAANSGCNSYGYIYICNAMINYGNTGYGVFQPIVQGTGQPMPNTFMYIDQYVNDGTLVIWTVENGQITSSTQQYASDAIYSLVPYKGQLVCTTIYC